MSARRESAGPSPRVLVVDDQADVREALRMLLESEDYTVVAAASPEEAVACLRGDEYAAVLADMNYSRDTTSGQEGLALVEQIAMQWPGVPVIVMTAWASLELAVEAMRLGAADFIEKPWQNTRLLGVLENRIALARSRRSEERLGAANALLLEETGDGFIAGSTAMQRLVGDLQRIAASDAPVLLLGENGTGKSMIAQLLHRWSARRGKQFVKLDVGGLSPGLFESELFGHVRGAFTGAVGNKKGRFALADGGTIFLDEIGAVSPAVQPKLLRVLQEREFEPLGSERTIQVDVRVIAATNRDLRQLVAEGRFQEDLYYRLNVIPIVMPPLRERREDIPMLVEHFIRRHARRAGRQLDGIEPEAMTLLTEAPWPGNVRELENTIERAVVLASGPVIRVADITLVSAASPGPQPLPSLNLKQNLDWVERETVRRALDAALGVKKDAAELMGISQRAMSYYLAKHRLLDDPERP